jgi:hypothetical protein
VPESLQDHCRRVVKAMADGRVIPLLGAGVNLCGRPADAAWVPGGYLPTGGELARHLAEKFDYPQDEALDLVRVSEYAYVMSGSGPLYEELHNVFDADYPISPLHQFLAELPHRLQQPDQSRRCQLIVTTNYDDALERAFRAAGEPFDLVCYIAEGDHRGKFVHWSPGGEPTLIQIPNEYEKLKPGKRTVILKIHGAIDRTGPEAEWDSYVITEDNYIDYLARTDIQNLVPVMLAMQLRRSHFLFLGYSMRDWNLRVILHRIWGAQRLKYKSWAIQRNPDKLEREFWGLRGVDVYDVPLEEYVPALEAALAQLERVPAGP